MLLSVNGCTTTVSPNENGKVVKNRLLRKNWERYKDRHARYKPIGVYELTEPANGHLFKWNARAIMVEMVEDSKPTDELRMTFDYSELQSYFQELFLSLV